MRTGGRIRDEDVEEVRRRANLADVAADYMQLKRAGRLWKALCPFHAEKTPSFSIDPGKNLYHCFGCHEGGDVITLVQKLESLSFVETIERLAQRTGVNLRFEELSPAERARSKRRTRLVEAHRAAVEHYHRLLMDAPEAADARRYLSRERGLSRETVERFGVGFSLPKWDDLVRLLGGKGFRDEELIEAGLAVRGQDGRVLDRFRGRVMFPIFEHVHGDPVAFGARRMGEGEGPKYLNSAESPIYKKSQMLYALSSAKHEIVKSGRALLVEGYTDVIALHQAGIGEAVATCGTALGLEHLRTIQRFTQQVVLSLDADEAGAGAAERMYDQLIADAQAMGLAVRIVLMPRGDDPADSVGKLGADGFRALVDEAVPLLGFVLRREADRFNVGDPESRARALAAGVRILARTEQEAVRMEYARRLADWIRVDANIVFVELDKALRTGTAPRAIGEAVLKRASAPVRLEREIIKLALHHPEHVKPFLDEVPPDHFTAPAHRAIWSALQGGADPSALSDRLDDETRRAYRALAVQDVVGEVGERLVAEHFGRLKEFAVVRQIEELKARLQRMNPENEPEEYHLLFAELIGLEGLKRRLTEGEET